MSPMGHDSLNLTTARGIVAYLSSSGPRFVSAYRATQLSGGFTNFVFRVHLSSEELKTVVVKHAKGYTASIGESNQIALERQAFEVTALRRVRASIGEDALVTVPEVYLFDKEKGICVMEDAGVQSLSLFELLAADENMLDVEVARTIGQELGRFLKALHERGREDEDGLKTIVKGNLDARRIAAWVAYSRLVSTLTGIEGKEEVRCLHEPTLLDLSKETLEVIAKVADDGIHKIMESTETVTMGDFWPPNVLIDLHPSGMNGKQMLKRVYVVDWEEVKPGVALLDDVGQFCGSLRQLDWFYEATKEGSRTILKAFLEAYAGHEPELGLKDVLMHIGAYIATWTARTSRFRGEEKKRQLTLEAVRYMVKGATSGSEWSVQTLLVELDNAPK